MRGRTSIDPDMLYCLTCIQRTTISSTDCKILNDMVMEFGSSEFNDKVTEFGASVDGEKVVTKKTF